ncbi:MAG TPA: helix-turn-helix transcriptional regulator [Stellaceae bacterium]|nr:helix-turn-helix transcriptional regulator [Stellaceae bacterium]
MSPASSRPRRRTAKEHGPDPIDVEVGRRVRLARELAHMTQVDVASRIGISFQLVQKYEQGEIRVSASRLYQFATLLQKPIDFFFAAAETEAANGVGRHEMELIEAYRRITNPEVKDRLSQLVRGMSQHPQDGVPKGRARSTGRAK